MLQNAQDDCKNGLKEYTAVKNTILHLTFQFEKSEFDTEIAITTILATDKTGRGGNIFGCG